MCVTHACAWTWLCKLSLLVACWFVMQADAASFGLDSNERVGSCNSISKCVLLILTLLY